MPGRNIGGPARALRGITGSRARLHKELDALFFEIVSWKYGNRCMRCHAAPRVLDKVSKKGKVYQQKQALTPHHFFCRSYWGTRWEPDNGFLLCYRCHVSWAQTRHEEFRDFILTKIGEARFAKLKMQAYNGTKPDPELVRIGLMDQLQRIQEKQARELQARMA